MDRYLKINAADTVAVAIEPLRQGERVTVDGHDIVLSTDVPAGHKFLLQDGEAGDDVIKYGYPIGRLRERHNAGEWVDHRHIKTNLSGLLDYEYAPTYTADELAAGQDARSDFGDDFLRSLPDTFQGYERKNGDVGIRNELWIVPTVGCVNGICTQLRDRIQQETDIRVVAYPHNYGCSQLGDDHETTRRVLRDVVLHPNAGGVLIVGLGCENNQPKAFEQLLGDYDHDRIRMMVAQEVDGDEVEAGLQILRQILAAMRDDQRTMQPISRLRVGLKCGGSDGFSGITANPLLGLFSDYFVRRGGTTVLTEVPEMFGAETILMNRCADRALFDQTVRMVNDFKSYFLSHGEPVGENPSPGNKAGGISTLEEKALGCTQKCGKSAVRGVLAYGDRLSVRGLNLLSAPGNDLVAATALAASGCHIVLFTTGRGTPFGTFVPTMKVSTNSGLAERKTTWIDFNAGVLTQGAKAADVLRDFAHAVTRVASGEQTWNEKKNYQEIAIFKNGVTL